MSDNFRKNTCPYCGNKFWNVFRHAQEIHPDKYQGWDGN